MKNKIRLIYPLLLLSSITQTSCGDSEERYYPKPEPDRVTPGNSDSQNSPGTDVPNSDDASPAPSTPAPSEVPDTPNPSPNPDPKPSPPPPGPDPSPTDECLETSEWTCRVEQAILQRINKIRMTHGAESLIDDPRVSWAARDWSRVQAERGFLGHERIMKYGAGHNEVLAEHFSGLNIPLIGENVAWQMVRSEDPGVLAQQIVDQWVASPGHYENLLKTKFHSSGIGLHIKGNTWWATQIFF